MKIIQVLPSLAFGDAVGNDTRALKRIISENGYKTQIYAIGIDSKLPIGTAQPASDIPKLDKNDIIIYHEAIGCDLAYEIQKQDCRKVMIYHNITPAEFFREYDNNVFYACKEGYKQLKNLTGAFDMILSDSAYNRQNLLDMGFTAPNHVLPILIPFDDYKKKPSEKILSKYKADGYTNIIFVGRVVPNKCQEDVIAAFNEYQKHFNQKSRLFIVGSFMETYFNRLKEDTERLGVKNVVFTGHCPFDEILAYYHLADLFLCQSEHEGFCVPLVEAMCFDVPIVAYDSSAIAETLGGSGFLLKEKDPLLTAGVMNRILTDSTLRETIVENQRERLQDFQYDKVKALFWKYMDSFINGGGYNKICFVVQRYGLEVNGGAELLCRLFAERMKKYYDVEVLSTKAIDYMTWRDEYTHRAECIHDVLVKRFGVTQERNQDCFMEVHDRFMNNALPVEQEQVWIERQGPYVPSLLTYLQKHQNEYKCIVFFTYLYYPTVMGIKTISQKAIVMPFAHDEPFLRMKIFDDVFLKPAGIVYSTEEEQKLIQQKYHNEHIKSTICGSGVDLPATVDGERFKEKYQLEEYIVYVGRIDYGKNCDELFSFFTKYKKHAPYNVKLVLLGKPVMPVPEASDIISLGFVSDQDKFDGIAGARALVLPSKFESLSMVVLEAMAVQTPVLINGVCEVLKAHCTKSNGGLYYTNYGEFEGGLNYLLNPANAEIVAQMKANAKRYVDENYQWDAICARLRGLIEDVSNERRF